MVQMTMPHPFLDDLLHLIPRLREIEARVAGEPAAMRQSVRQQEAMPLLIHVEHPPGRCGFARASATAHWAHSSTMCRRAGRR